MPQSPSTTSETSGAMSEPPRLSPVLGVTDVAGAFMSATFTTLAVDPDVAAQRPFMQPLCGHVPRIHSRQSPLDLSRVERNSARAVETDGPQPVLGGHWSGSEALNRAAPCAPLIGHSGQVLITSIVGRYGEDAPQFEDDRGSGAPEDPTERSTRRLAELRRVRAPRPSPSARSGHVLLPLESRRSLILHGGLGEISLNDTWEFDVATATWQELDAGVLPLNEFVAAVTAHRNGSPVAPAPRSLVDREEVDHARRVETDDDDEESEEREDDGGVQPDPLALPPRAFGQAATVCSLPQFPGESFVMVYGGITDSSSLCRGIHLLHVATKTWTLVPTSIPLPQQWGGVMHAMRAPVRADDVGAAETANGKEERDEDVVVIFGGMITGSKFLESTYIIHMDHRLTEQEVVSNPKKYLGPDFEEMERQFIKDAITSESRKVEEQLLTHAPQYRLDDLAYISTQTLRRPAPWSPPDDTPEAMLPNAAAAEYAALMSDVDDVIDLVRRHTATSYPNVDDNVVNRWRSMHAQEIEEWLKVQLKPLVGTYWVEELPNPPLLRGRRRACASVYRDKFLFVFGGRDGAHFYNDVWVFNVQTRMWVPVRAELPSQLYQRFFSRVEDSTAGAQLQVMHTLLKEKQQKEITAKNLPLLHKLREEQERLYNCPANSTAVGRTGAVMSYDAQRECMYVYGGFALDKNQYLTFFDMHAYYIREHRWRRLTVLDERDWDLHMDAAEDVLLPFSSLDEAREYPRFTAYPQQRAGAWKEALLSRANGKMEPSLERRLPVAEATWRRDGCQTGSMTVVAYANRYMQLPLPPSCAAPRVLPSVLQPTGRGVVLARRGQRRRLAHPTQYASSARGAPADAGAAAAAENEGDAAELFPLPVLTPEPRTMAGLVVDPTSCGNRFFLFGGRSDDLPLGDMFVLNVNTFSVLDSAVHQLQRKLRAKPLPATLQYNEMRDLQRRLRCATADGLLRSHSLEDSAAEQLNGTVHSERVTGEPSSVYHQSLMWLRGVLEMPTSVAGLVPDIVPDSATGGLAFLITPVPANPTPGPVVSRPPAPESSSAVTQFLVSMRAALGTRRTHMLYDAAAVASRESQPKANANVGTANSRLNELAATYGASALSCSACSDLFKDLNRVLLPNSETTAVLRPLRFSGHRILHVLFAPREYWRKNSLHEATLHEPLTVPPVADEDDEL